MEGFVLGCYRRILKVIWIGRVGTKKFSEECKRKIIGIHGLDTSSDEKVFWLKFRKVLKREDTVMVVLERTT